MAQAPSAFWLTPGEGDPVPGGGTLKIPAVRTAGRDEVFEFAARQAPSHGRGHAGSSASSSTGRSKGRCHGEDVVLEPGGQFVREMRPGEILLVTDVEGQQVADLVAFASENLSGDGPARCPVELSPGP